MALVKAGMRASFAPPHLHIMVCIARYSSDLDWHEREDIQCAKPRLFLKANQHFPAMLLGRSMLSMLFQFSLQNSAEVNANVSQRLCMCSSHCPKSFDVILTRG